MDWPSLYGSQYAVNSGMSGSTGTTITTGANNAKGSYAQIVASTPMDAEWILMTMLCDDNVAADILVDLAIGASSSEVIVVNNLGLFLNGGMGGQALKYFLPLSIPAGTRLSARGQNSSAGTRGVEMTVMLGAGGLISSSPLQQVLTFGANTGDSGGVSIDPGGSANTKGSWVELSASVGADLHWLVFYFGSQINTARTTGSWLIDIGVGAGGSEVPLVTDMQIFCHSVGDFLQPNPICIPVHLPNGSRLSARAQSSITDATDRLFDLVVYGVA